MFACNHLQCRLLFFKHETLALLVQLLLDLQYISRCLSVLDFWNVNLGVYYKLEKKSISKQTRFFVEFELDFYCLCSLQKSISKSNWFFDFLNLIFWNWKKIDWHSIFQKSSGDRQGVWWYCKLLVLIDFWFRVNS